MAGPSEIIPSAVNKRINRTGSKGELQLRVLWLLDKLAGSALLAAGFILFWKEWNTTTGIDNVLLAAGFIFIGAFVLLVVNPKAERG